MEAHDPEKGAAPGLHAPASTDSGKTETPVIVSEKPAETKDVSPEREPSIKDYIRVFTYANKWDILMLVAACTASVGAGITLPLMNVVFGRQIGNINAFAGDAQAATTFQDTLNKQSLYMFALFIARFGLNYINKVGSRD